MRAIPLCTAVLFALAACNAQQPPARSVGSTPVGTNAGTDAPTLSSQGAGPGGINADYYTGSDPNFPRGSSGSRRSSFR